MYAINSLLVPINLRKNERYETVAVRKGQKWGWGIGAWSGKPVHEIPTHFTVYSFKHISIVHIEREYLTIEPK